MKIEKGLFKGTEIPEHELVPYKDDAGNLRFRADGTQLMYWPSALRTPLFLEKFAPTDGWQVRIHHEDLNIALPDRYRGANGEVVQQPTNLFVAQLVKDDKVFAEATSLAVLWGASAWEIGESVARGRLYDAMGLSYARSFDTTTNQPQGQTTGASGTRATTGAGQVIPIDRTARANTGNATPAVETPAPAEVVDVAGTAQSEPVAAETVATAEASAPVGTKVEAPRVVPNESRNGHIESNLLRQIELQAAAKGVEIPVFADTAEAKSFYRDLLTGKLERRAS